MPACNALSRRAVLALALSFALTCFSVPAYADPAGTAGASSPAADAARVAARDLPPPEVAATAPTIVAEAAVVMDRNTGQVLYAKNADLPYYPASLTKILTAVLLLEHTKPDDVLTASAEAIMVEPSAIFLQEGEQITAEKALAALMLQSANDVANVIAEHVAGSTEAFAALMNERARAMGATHSTFRNPHGLHDDGHVVTALDMARIARVALNEHPELEAIASFDGDVYPLDREVEPRYLTNRNRLLSMVEGAYGLKNGYTDEAGYTFVGAARRGDLDLIAVVLRSQPDIYYEDAARLLEWAFDNFAVHEVVREGQVLGTLAVPRGDREAELIAGSSVRVTASRAAAPTPSAEIRVDESLAAPLADGTVVGTYEGRVAGQPFRVPVLTRGDIGVVWWAWLGSRWYVYGGALLLLFFLRNYLRLRAYERRLRERASLAAPEAPAEVVMPAPAASPAPDGAPGARPAPGIAAAGDPPADAVLKALASQADEELPIRRTITFPGGRSPIWEVNERRR